MDELHIQDSSNCCRHRLKQPISQKFYSHFWRVFDIWPICAPGGKGNRGRNSMNCDLLYVPNERNNYARVNEARAPLYNSTLIYGFGTSSEKHLGKHCTNVGFLDSASANVQTVCILILQCNFFARTIKILLQNLNFLTS